MASESRSSSSPLTRRCEALHRLTDEEHAALERLQFQKVMLRRGQDIVREGDRPTRSCILISGLVCWFKMTGDGKRQIIALHFPGDIPDMQSIHLDRMDASLGTLADSEVAFVPHDQMRQLVHQFPRIGDILWRATLIDAAIFREWVLNVGSRQALSRVSHLFCEIFARLKDIGLTTGNTCQLQITQGEIADATGLSVVHVNRTIQDLRSQRLISLRGNLLKILAWDRLQETADFEPSYLFLNSSYRAIPDDAAAN